MAMVGRPRVENLKNKTVAVRLTEAKYKEIADYASEHKQTISKTMIDGFELLKKQEESK